jgi:ATP-dependent exoDNAse (exonuclease V) beta subunit
MQFGSEVHAVLEQVGWIDENPPNFPPGEAAKWVIDLLKIPSLRQHFERKGKAIELFREQAVDALLDGQWLSGIIDRLHLHHDLSGKVTRVQVIDFKTDGLDEIAEFVQRYSGQMHAYREVMKQAYPDAQIECLLLSTRLRELVAV